MCKLHIEPASLSDVPIIMDMEQASDNADYIIPYQQQQHIQQFQDSNSHYLKILLDKVVVGFILLVANTHQKSVECRRIVVTHKGQGIGQQALIEMEHFVKSTLGFSRIWLDVFEHNQRGQHIYGKLGYCAFDRGQHQGQPLVLMEKQLS